MRYLVYAFCALTVLWMVWLCIRWPMPRIPGQIRVYRQDADGFGALVAVLLLNSLFLWLSMMAVDAGAWFIWPITLGAAMASCGFMSRSIVRSIVFSEEALAVRGLFGPLQTYRWEDVSAYTARTEHTGKHHNIPFDMYRLTLPDRVLEVSSTEDSGRELLQVFERRRPDLQAIRLPKK